MNEYLDALDPKELQDQMRCKICSNPPTDPQITDVSTHSIGFSPCTNEMLVRSYFLQCLPCGVYA
jgi:hypothetical protein